MNSQVYHASSVVSGERYRIPADVADAQRSFMSTVEHNITTSIRVARDQSQLEMINLNDRLADYIEKICFMKDQNQYLASALEAMKEKSQNSETISIMYDAEASEIQNSIAQLNKESNLLQEEILAEQHTFDNLLDKYQEAIKDYNISEAEAKDLRRKYSALKAKINLINDEIEDLAGKVDRINKQNDVLRQAVSEAQKQLDDESRLEAGARTDVNTLLEECKTISSTYEYEIEKIVASKRGTTLDERQELKQQLADDIRKIREEYENLIRRDIGEIQQRYQITQLVPDNSEIRLKVIALRQELNEQRRMQNEAEGRRADLEKQKYLYQKELEEEQRVLERLHSQNYESVRQVSNELRTLMSEVQMTMKSNQNLDAEITLYRQMLEGAEERAGYRQL